MPRKRSKNEALRRFQSQEEAAQFLIDSIGSHFNFRKEVWASGPPNERYRLDAVSVCPSSGYILGWEFKPSHLFKSEFADCLRQATYYRMSHFDDARFPDLTGKQPNACIVFPGWDGLHDDGSYCYAGEARGMQLLASHFRVGVVTFPEKQAGLSIVIGESAVWHSWQGWTGNAAGVLTERRPLGSLRKRDRFQQ